jgi:ferredoxin
LIGTVTSVTASGETSPEQVGRVGAVRVWIDQDLCTGDGLCLDHAPDVFVQLEDGIAYVAEDGVALNDPGGSGSLAWVPARAEQQVIDAAVTCPGECIFIEMDQVSAA